jgi:8-oxo-dGTP pyrophosphatase MutT (NUDIX family)
LFGPWPDPCRGWLDNPAALSPAAAPARYVRRGSSAAGGVVRFLLTMTASSRPGDYRFSRVNRFQVVPAAYLHLLRDAGPELEVLLQLRGPETSYMAGHWASGAAGHVELGESVFAAAAREADEELGISVDPADLTPLCVLQRTQPGCDDPVEQRADFFLTARRWSGEPVVQEPGKATELRWCALSALPEPMVPHEREVLRRLASGAVPAVISLGFDAT